MSINGLETEFESKRATEAKRWGGVAVGSNRSLSAFPFVLLLCTGAFAWGAVSTK